MTTDVQDLVFKLKEASLKISFAESCTGGLIGATVTSVPGSSDVMMGSAVTYSDQSKTDILGVPADIIAKNGAVSEPTAIAMAKGSRRIYRSDIAVAVTGIAGPGGATPTKPVGLVFIAIDDRGDVGCEMCQFSGSREEVREQTVEKALAMISEAL